MSHWYFLLIVQNAVLVTAPIVWLLGRPLPAKKEAATAPVPVGSGGFG